MKPGETIKQAQFPAGAGEIALAAIYPVRELSGGKPTDVKMYIGDKLQTPFLDGSTYCNRITFTLAEPATLDVVCGIGYVAEKDQEWTDRFSVKQGWAGGDGIYSFNLLDGRDQFDQQPDYTNLFVFGDTLVGRTDIKTRRRYEPLLMPNNSLGYLDPGKKAVEFRINTNDKDSVVSFFAIDPKDDVRGTVPQNVVTYDRRQENDGWLSGYNPRNVVLAFDLHQECPVDRIRILNYYSPESPTLSSRGIKVFQLFASNDGFAWTFLGEFLAGQSFTPEDFTEIDLKESYRYFKFEINPNPGIGNYEDEYHEGLFGLKRVEFLYKGKLYRDIRANASSILLEDPARAWIWLQDGAVIGNQLYFFPYTVIQDLKQPEGLQFAIKGISMIRVPIENNRLLHQLSYQKPTPFFAYRDNAEYTLGGAVMANTLQAGAKDPDGYVYVYGYKTANYLRQMIASRVRPEDIEYFDRWQFFDGKGYTDDIFRAQPLIDHISCEFSVSRLLSGHYAGKYIAFFTFDTDTPEVAFAIGDTPVGPFTSPQVIYIAPEKQALGKTAYSYNAKAHPQLSESKSILVSYNVNTYSFDHNMECADVYNPRFIRLKEIS